MSNSKKFFVVSLLILLSHFSFGQFKNHTVKITNLKQVKGNLYIGWYNDPSTFRINEKAIYRKKIAITDEKEIVVEFIDIPHGRYAIAVFLDENDNYALDKNAFGIPKEKYGFSNNILPLFRPATYKEAAFELHDKESVITIKLK